MLRKVLTFVASSSLAIGISTASAQSDLSKQSLNVPLRAAAPAAVGPLAPGGAAGIRQAQGANNRVWNYVPFAVVGGLALLIVLATGDDDNEATTTTTGTH